MVRDKTNTYRIQRAVCAGVEGACESDRPISAAQWIFGGWGRPPYYCLLEGNDDQASKCDSVCALHTQYWEAWGEICSSGQAYDYWPKVQQVHQKYPAHPHHFWLLNLEGGRGLDTEIGEPQRWQICQSDPDHHHAMPPSHQLRKIDLRRPAETRNWNPQRAPENSKEPAFEQAGPECHPYES